MWDWNVSFCTVDLPLMHIKRREDVVASVKLNINTIFKESIDSYTYISVNKHLCTVYEYSLIVWVKSDHRIFSCQSLILLIISFICKF
jgi:hypothetical protein